MEPTKTWQEILRDTFFHRRTRIHGPLYWTGWFFVKAVSGGKYPNETWRGDVLMTLSGIVIWLVMLVVIAIYNNM